ncbi:PepSY-associated TM helix domain-containing protein [Chondrinema litorale]|uniref:PepSY-associated TM helix domain-containing protein n=1 Tax=Chondrinema litorale TaxID=2994555 RepID=UPI0025429F04|nr:PepSY-associated TM helix domain-containing protein [Chondrinema litorale]UZR96360.1 PepSY-associated TM helix domain-containing protein [Chondrinema litorale]
MSKRDYNVFFNTHTVSGIVISIGLYVIFFAGAFALFMENIDHWETNEPKETADAIIDYDGLIAEVASKGYDMHGRTFLINGHGENININSRPLRDSTLVSSSLDILPDSVAKGPIKLELNANNYAASKANKEKKQKAELGNFLFDLHYFNQIPVVGIILSGLVSLFFLFAIISGIIIHWDKIFSNFFTFRLKGSVKNLWTDAHTALGVIGLPYQLMYALTGTVFGLTILLFFPYAQVLYGGSQQAMLAEVFPAPATQSYELHGYSESSVAINPLVEQTVAQLSQESSKHISVSIKNFHDKNAHLIVGIINDQKSSFFNTVESIYLLADGKLIREKKADDLPPYAVGMVEFLHKIHFGQYGGNFVKLIYFLLALLTCLVIISGVMVWLKARNTKKYLAKQKFNTNVGAIYLGVCLGLYPAIALLFILSKTFPVEMENRFIIISWLFLAFWVLYSVYSYRIKNYFLINRNALILSGTFGIAIPIFNGFHSGLWLWKSLSLGYPDTFFVDLIWLLSGAITLLVAVKLRSPQPEKVRKKVAVAAVN